MGEVFCMGVIKVAILGFGTVGEGVYRTIQTHAEELTAAIGKRVEVAAILIKNKQKKRNINEKVLVTTDFNDIINLPQIDVVVEAIVGKEQPFIYVKEAIKKGCNVITANKEMFAHHGVELFELAQRFGVSLGFEATVGGGIPIIQTLRQLLKINRVHQIQGIVNGTSNFILTEMREKKQSFAAALLEAQKNGFAEADPTNDVEGFDAFFKTIVLSKIAFGEDPNWSNIELQGITSITSELIEEAENLGLRFKHIANLYKHGDEIKGSVKPALVSKSHAFYHVEGVENAFNIHTDLLGRITLQGPGAGMFPTASAVIEDLVYVCDSKPAKLKKSTVASESVDGNAKQTQEVWFVKGIKAPAKDIIQKVTDDTYIIEASQIEVDQLVRQHENCCYFPILGEYQASKMKQKEALNVI
jgi:homoserine dehydrogenase